MNALEIKHQLNLKKWTEEFEAFTQSGMKVSDWCRFNNIAPSTFSMHRRAVLSENRIATENASKSNIVELIKADMPVVSSLRETNTVSFAQVNLSPMSDHDDRILIERGSLTINIGPHVDTLQLKTVLEVLINAD